MEAYITDWLSLFFRWLHLITGIAWIGGSFYFVWLDNSLEEPPQWKKDKGIKGDLWSIHGGGIYEVAKYQLGPEKMPAHLHWFKWEAYTTWMTGFILLWIVYYLGADLYLLKPGGPLASGLQATLVGLGLLGGGLAVYEGMVRSPLRHHGLAFAIALTTVFLCFSWLTHQLFSPRGAVIHLGALIGTIMAGNVLLGIIPSQRALVAAIAAKRQPDPAPASFAKLRSTHNNYLTLPVLFIMISNHYPMVYTHTHSWLLIIGICVIAAFARHFFNLRHKGQFKPVIPAVAALLLLGLAAYMAPSATIAPSAASSAASAGGAKVTDQQALAIVQNRCAVCHATQPADTLFTAAPAGLLLQSLQDIQQAGYLTLYTVTQSGYMPLANRSGMTDEERAVLLEWLRDNTDRH